MLFTYVNNNLGVWLSFDELWSLA